MGGIKSGPLLIRTHGYVQQAWTLFFGEDPIVRIACRNSYANVLSKVNGYVFSGIRGRMAVFT